ncbi:MAG: phosphatase PAP2 family protein [Anaerolineales bacterium]
MVRLSLNRLWHWLGRHRWSLLGLFVGVLIPLGLFAALAEDVIEQESFFFDEPILLLLYGSANPALDTFMLFWTRLGYPGIIAIDVAGLAVLLWRHRWGDALFWSLALEGAGLLNVVTKAFFGRPRPDLWLSLAPDPTFSFPSGHAMGVMALVTAAVVLMWPTAWRWPVLIAGSGFTLLVGLSRMYLGVHYPSDILAGWAAAAGWVLGLSLIAYGRVVKPRPEVEPH